MTMVPALRRQKTWLRIVSVAVALLLLAACGSNETAQVDGDQSAQPPTATPIVAPTVVAVEQPTASPTSVPVPATASVPAPTAAVTPVPSPIPSPTPRPPHECTLDPSPPGPAGATALQVEVVASGLAVPWGLAILPSGDLLLTERSGSVRLIEQGALVTEPVAELAVDLPPPLFGVDRLGPEGGLLGLVLHPEFTSNRLFYVFYNLTDNDGVFIGRVERHRLADDGRSATLDRIIIDDLPAGVHHQGGRMAIGPDGHLYVGVGAFDPPAAQDPATLAGKLLRLGLDGQIPADNPNPASPIFISGIRNSQGFDWIDADHLVMVDHGPSGLELDMPELRGFDEINVVQAGENLGWPRVWGCDEADDLVSPVLTWTDSVPPTGAMIYRGDAIADWKDSLLFTVVGRAATGHHLHRAIFSADNPYEVVGHETYLRGEYGRLRTVVEADDGSLYVMTSNCDGRGVCPPQGDLVLKISAVQEETS